MEPTEPTESTDPIAAALHAAVEAAREFEGATAPNPPVGAAALDAEGKIISIHAHEKAGTAHAEAKVIDDCRARGLLDSIKTLVVTLEPCNHHGKTPPCTEAILQAGIRHVVFGARDPNPNVQGGGAQRLKDAGVHVESIESEECKQLIRAFAHVAKTGLPWITIKTAHRSSSSSPSSADSMIPPTGQKTFTSENSLRFAHALRKRADAIITGSGTVIADLPLFTVRHLKDHLNKTRYLVVLDRRGRTPRQWIEDAQARGFQVEIAQDFDTAVRILVKRGVIEILVEAGPSLSNFILNRGSYNEHVVITQGAPRNPDRNPDSIEIRSAPACSPGLSKN